MTAENAAYHFNPDTAKMEVHVVRPIAAGEEITASYIRYLEKDFSFKSLQEYQATKRHF